MRSSLAISNWPMWLQPISAMTLGSWYTIAAFAAAGGRLYNHAVMMLPLHSLPMRAPAAFKASAKLGMCHQHVLVFYCGGKSPKAELLHHPGLKNAMRPQAWA